MRHEAHMPAVLVLPFRLALLTKLWVIISALTTKELAVDLEQR